MVTLYVNKRNTNVTVKKCILNEHGAQIAILHKGPLIPSYATVQKVDFKGCAVLLKSGGIHSCKYYKIKYNAIPESLTF